MNNINKIKQDIKANSFFELSQKIFNGYKYKTFKLIYSHNSIENCNSQLYCYLNSNDINLNLSYLIDYYDKFDFLFFLDHCISKNFKIKDYWFDRDNSNIYDFIYNNKYNNLTQPCEKILLINNNQYDNLIDLILYKIIIPALKNNEIISNYIFNLINGLVHNIVLNKKQLKDLIDEYLNYIKLHKLTIDNINKKDLFEYNNAYTNEQRNILSNFQFNINYHIFWFEVTEHQKLDCDMFFDYIFYLPALLDFCNLYYLNHMECDFSKIINSTGIGIIKERVIHKNIEDYYAKYSYRDTLYYDGIETHLYDLPNYIYYKIDCVKNWKINLFDLFPNINSYNKYYKPINKWSFNVNGKI